MERSFTWSLFSNKNGFINRIIYCKIFIYSKALHVFYTMKGFNIHFRQAVNYILLFHSPNLDKPEKTKDKRRKYKDRFTACKKILPSCKFLSPFSILDLISTCTSPKYPLLLQGILFHKPSLLLLPQVPGHRLPHIANCLKKTYHLPMSLLLLYPISV